MRITAALKSEIVPYKETVKVVRCLAMSDGSPQMWEFEVAATEDIDVGEYIRIENKEPDEYCPHRVFIAKVVSVMWEEGEWEK